MRGRVSPCPASSGPGTSEAEVRRLHWHAPARQDGRVSLSGRHGAPHWQLKMARTPSQGGTVNRNFTIATPEWESAAGLRSPLYDDAYFSTAGAIAESRFVFQYRNRLPHRFLGIRNFHICEAGFGTGLNLLLAMELWETFAPRDAELVYTGVEAHPIPAGTLQEVYRPWPELSRFSDRLLSVYPEPEPGMHECRIPGTRITLRLLFDDINNLEPRILTPVDAWYLDGFAPKANPAMWSETLFSMMGKKTRPGGTFATFTSVGFVRRGLLAAGFHVEKIRGFNRKREMLRGVLHG